MRRTKEGGSVLGFVVVGIVLAALLVGGVYFINRQLTQQSPMVEGPQKQEPDIKDKQSPPPAEPGNKSDQKETPESPQAGVSHELPATGPRETVGTMLVIGLVAGTSVGYIRSRRIRFSL